eukprot:365362-Chlamydomonas_euryale.AAC.22
MCAGRLAGKDLAGVRGHSSTLSRAPLAADPRARDLGPRIHKSEAAPLSAEFKTTCASEGRERAFSRAAVKLVTFGWGPNAAPHFPRSWPFHCIGALVASLRLPGKSVGESGQPSLPTPHDRLFGPSLGEHSLERAYFD